MRLLAVEVRRIRARRLVAVVTVIGLLAVGLLLVGAWQSARPLTEAQLQDAQQQYAWALEDWEENGEEMLADCRESQERESEIAGEQLDFGCEQMGPPQEEWFLPQATELSASAPTTLSTASAMLLFLVFVVGVTATAAEMTSGAMSTWLTFVPQRLRVLFSKVGASTVVGVPITAVLVAALVGGLYVVHAVQGSLGDLTGAFWGEIAGTALRIVVLGGVAAGVGAALGVLLKHTGVALGVAIGYAVIVESAVSGIAPRLQPFLVQTNVRGWVEGGTTYWARECEVTAEGTACQYADVPLSFAHSSVFLAVGVLVLLGLTALVFRRRDVA